MAIRIGYVPEHFSTPLLMARDKGFFSENGVSVELVCCPGGTGEMTQKLKSKEIDIAVALTEGLVAGISQGHDWYKIAGTYVGAPLCWAISTGANSKHGSVDTLNKTNVAISRFGSGSHIMAYVLADQQGWLGKDEEPFTFSALNNFQAMRDAVNADKCDYFMWETFTTKPYHDSGEVKRIGQITPPWPAFLFAAHTDLIRDRSKDIKKVFRATEKASALFMEQKENESVQLVMNNLGYKEEDVRNWFKTVHYAAEQSHVSRSALQTTITTLLRAKVVSAPGPSPENLIDASVTVLSQ